VTRLDHGDSDPLDQAMTGGSAGDAAPTGFNILREKTFNENLRKLIHRIEDHESTAPQAGDEARGRINEITEEELIKRFHGLHYRIDNIDEHLQSHTAFDPFRHGSPGRPLTEQVVAEEIGSILSRLGYGAYAILRYSMPDRCFRPFINRIPFLPDDDFILALDEPLYQRITSAPHGAVLERSDFAGGAFLRRTLVLSEFGDDHVVLALECRPLAAGIIGELGMKWEAAAPGFMPSPLLLLYYDPKKIPVDPEKCIEILAGRLAVPLLLADIQGPERQGGGSETLLEQLIPLFFKKPSHRCVLVRCSAEDVSGYFLMKFLYEKLLRILNPDSSILLVRPRSIFLIIMDEKIQTVQNITDHWGKIMNNSMILSVYNSFDYHHPTDLLKTILLNM
jgi:hypothetical protein